MVLPVLDNNDKNGGLEKLWKKMMVLDHAGKEADILRRILNCCASSVQLQGGGEEIIKNKIRRHFSQASLYRN